MNENNDINYRKFINIEYKENIYPNHVFRFQLLFVYKYTDFQFVRGSRRNFRDTAKWYRVSCNLRNFKYCSF